MPAVAPSVALFIRNFIVLFLSFQGDAGGEELTSSAMYTLVLLDPVVTHGSADATWTNDLLFVRWLLVYCQLAPRRALTPAASDSAKQV